MSYKPSVDLILPGGPYRHVMKGVFVISPEDLRVYWVTNQEYNLPSNSILIRPNVGYYELHRAINVDNLSWQIRCAIEWKRGMIEPDDVDSLSDLGRLEDTLCNPPSESKRPAEYMWLLLAETFKEYLEHTLLSGWLRDITSSIQEKGFV